MSPVCPFCSAGSYSIIYDVLPQFRQAKLAKCKSCRHVFTVIETDINTADLYTNQDEVYKVVDNRNSIFDKILNFEYNTVLRKLGYLDPGKGDLLDFGSGKGKFASLAMQQGWQVKGVETSPDRAAYSKKIYNVDVNSDFFSSGKIFNKNFNAITLFHVLEHLPKPVQLLHQLITDNLDKNGVVVLEVPNYSSLQSVIAKNNWIHLDIPRHLSHFTPEKFEELVARCEMVPVKRSYFSFHLGVLGMVDSLMKLFGYKRNIIFELKNKKTIPLILGIVFILPFALILESTASLFRKGGIIRIYCKRKDV